MIVGNPFAALLKVPSRASSQRPVEREALLNHQALEQSVAALQALLGIPDPRHGQKLVEFHEDVPIAVGTTIVRHDLGRVPKYLVPLRTDSARVLISLPQEWSDTQIAVSSTGTMTVSFLLF